MHKLFEEENHLLITIVRDRGREVIWKLVEEWGRASVAEKFGGTQVSVPGEEVRSS